MKMNSSREIFLARLGIGLIQGLGLYLLYLTASLKLWPATHPYIFIPVVTIFIFVPFLIAQSIGHFHQRTFYCWPIIVTLFLTVLAYFDVGYHPVTEITATLSPSVEFIFYMSMVLFIAQSLLLSGNTDRRFFASYATYFDVSWRVAVQLVLIFMFVVLFWGLLNLGATLFSIIKINFLNNLFEKSWFYFPATTLMIMIALHTTDVRMSILQGIRTVLLLLLSWLLPIITVLVGGFLISLLFTGLTSFLQATFPQAMFILLFSAKCLIILINATYQDGSNPPSVFLRYIAKTACILLLPLGLLAFYVWYLWIGDSSWTPSQITAAWCLLIIGCYAIGYLFAALRSGPWLKFIEKWNIGNALVVLAILILLFITTQEKTTIPALLNSNKLATKSFHFSVHPSYKKIPSSFLMQDISRLPYIAVSSCITQKTNCDIWLIDMNHDGKEEIVFLDSNNNIFIALQEIRGEWRVKGIWNFPYNCPSVTDAAKKAMIKFVTPESIWPDILIKGVRLRFMFSDIQPACVEK